MTRRYVLSLFLAMFVLTPSFDAYPGNIYQENKHTTSPSARVLNAVDIADIPAGINLDQLVELFGPPIRMEWGPFLTWPKQRTDLNAEDKQDDYIWLGSGYWFLFEKSKDTSNSSLYVLTLVASFPEGVFAEQRALFDQFFDMTVEWPLKHKGKNAKSVLQR